MRNGTAMILAVPDKITHRHGRRVYLAKGVWGTPARMRQGYPQCDIFNTIRTEAAGPASKFTFVLSRRLVL